MLLNRNRVMWNKSKSVKENSLSFFMCECVCYFTKFMYIETYFHGFPYFIIDLVKKKNHVLKHMIDFNLIKIMCFKVKLTFTASYSTLVHNQ